MTRRTDDDEWESITAAIDGETDFRCDELGAWHTCQTCRGSGEGQFEGTSCLACRGRCEVFVEDSA